jgi:hypothetical protein
VSEDDAASTGGEPVLDLTGALALTGVGIVVIRDGPAGVVGELLLEGRGSGLGCCTNASSLIGVVAVGEIRSLGCAALLNAAATVGVTGVGIDCGEAKAFEDGCFVETCLFNTEEPGVGSATGEGNGTADALVERDFGATNAGDDACAGTGAVLDCSMVRNRAASLPAGVPSYIMGYDLQWNEITICRTHLEDWAQ